MEKAFNSVPPTIKTDIRHYIVRTRTLHWQALHEPGIDTSGIFVKPLRVEESGRPSSILLRFEPGARYPYHNHPAGEELLVLEGSCIIEDETLSAGDYLYTPPGFRHSVRTETGCLLLFIVPEEVEILDFDPV